MNVATTHALDTYIIRGGEADRARLAIVSRVLFPTTRSLLDRFEPLQNGLLIDAGCGGGDVTFELAARAGPAGRAIGLDADTVKVELARQSAADRGIDNVEFHPVDLLDAWPAGDASLVYIRFVLIYMPDPQQLLARARQALRPGGVLVISGATSGQNPPASLNRIFFLQLSVVGSTMGTRDELDRLVRLCVERDVRPVIEAEVPLASAREAFEALAAGDVFGKLVLTV